MTRSQDYSPEERESILERVYESVASGTSLDRTLRTVEGMPAPATFWRWHMSDVNVRDNLARARELGVEALLERALDVAETPMPGDEVTEEDVLVKGKKTGTARKIVTKDMIAHRRLVVDTYIKRAQMIAPRKYGPKVDLTSGGEPIGHRSMSDVAAEAAALIAVARDRKEQGLPPEDE